jgi:hypothetical protein
MCHSQRGYLISDTNHSLFFPQSHTISISRVSDREQQLCANIRSPGLKRPFQNQRTHLSVNASLPFRVYLVNVALKGYETFRSSLTSAATSTFRKRSLLGQSGIKHLDSDDTQLARLRPIFEPGKSYGLMGQAPMFGANHERLIHAYKPGAPCPPPSIYPSSSASCLQTP